MVRHRRRVAYREIALVKLQNVKVELRCRGGDWDKMRPIRVEAHFSLWNRHDDDNLVARMKDVLDALEASGWLYLDRRPYTTLAMPTQAIDRRIDRTEAGLALTLVATSPTRLEPLPSRPPRRRRSPRRSG